MANTTRKSLAVVAASALAITGLSAAPAQAASVSTVVADGSTYVGLMGEDNFNLTVSFSQDIANFNNAKVLIGNPDGLVFDVDATDINDAGDDVNVEVLAADATDVLGVGDADGRSFEVSIGNPAPDAAGEVTIQAIIDNDGDGEASAGDILGPVRTITFLDPADVTFSGAYGAIGIGDAQAAITISVSDNVNITQIDPANFAVALTDNAGQDIDADDTTIALDGDDMVATIDVDADANVATDISGDATNGTGETAISAAGLNLVAVVTYDDGDAPAVTSAQLLKNVAAAQADGEADNTVATANLKGVAGAWEARGGYTGTHTLTVGFTDGADAVADVAVDVTVAEVIDADTTITANGRSLEDGDDDLEYTLTTNADGEIEVTIRSNTGTDTDQVTVTWAVDGVTDSATVTWEDAEIESVVLNDYATGVANVTDADSLTVAVTLVDTFGVQASGAYRVAFTGADDDKFVSAANGTASATVTFADGVANVTATAQKQAAADGNFYALNAGDLAADEAENDAEAVTLTVNDADTDFAATTLGAAIDDANIDILGQDYVTGDTRTSLFSSDYVDGELDADNDPTHAVLSVNVDDGAGAAAAATVTFSAVGLAFSEANTVYTTDSITVKTAADGTASVNVYGNVAGDYVITVSGAGLSDTLDLEILAAKDYTGTTLTASADQSVLPGSSLTVSATLTDDYGNPVDTDGANNAAMEVEYDGPGSTVPVDVADLVNTNASGAISLRTTFGANDEGEVTVTFTYDADTTDADNDLVTATTTLTVAPAPAPVAVDSVMVTGVAEVVAGEDADFTITVKDADGNALAGRTVSMSEAGVGEITALTAVTDANGQATTKLVTSSAGNSYITATAEGKTHTLLVKVVSPVPGQVTGLSASAGVESIALSWTAADGVVADYKVEWTTDGETWNVYADGVSTAASASITGLTAGTEYTFRVSASNSTGSGAVSASAAATPTAPVVEPEPEPEPVGVVNVGSFNGKVVVYALGLEGSTVSWKIAGKWQKVEVTDSALQRYDRPTAAIGLDIKVDIYVDGELRLSKTVTTK